MSSEKQGLQSFDMLRTTGMQPTKKNEIWEHIGSSLSTVGQPKSHKKLGRHGGSLLAGVAGFAIVAAGASLVWYQSISHTESAGRSNRADLPADRQTAATTTDHLHQSTVDRMANFALAHQVSFPVYIPVAGLSSTDYSVKSMTSQPSFTLHSRVRVDWVTISEYSSTTDGPIGALSWTQHEMKKDGMKYWSHDVANHITDYYFLKGSTVIMIEDNAKGSPSFPTRLVNSLEPLYTFTSSK